MEDNLRSKGNRTFDFLLGNGGGISKIGAYAWRCLATRRAAVLSSLTANGSIVGAMGRGSTVCSILGLLLPNVSAFAAPAAVDGLPVRIGSSGHKIPMVLPLETTAIGVGCCGRPGRYTSGSPRARWTSLIVIASVNIKGTVRGKLEWMEEDEGKATVRPTTTTTTT